MFGSADGWVYCLRASDGEMVWKFRAAPTDRRIVAHGRVESAWPVHGSVLVRDDMVYAVAGRSSNLDGGIHVYQLDMEAGRVMAHERLTASPDGIARRRQQGPTDLLSADKHSLYMQFQRWRLADLKPLWEKSPGPGESPRLICPTGFLENSCAGPPSVVKEGPPETFLDRSRLNAFQAQAALDAWEGRSGAMLWAVSSEDGTKLAELQLKSVPVWDGMAAIPGMLLMACEDNALVCFRAPD